MATGVAILAGGAGSRIGGDKALVELAGRPLIAYPLEAAAGAGLQAVVVAKRGTRLPALRVPVLLEPDLPLHPLLGVVTALASFATVIALPCDMPFVDGPALTALAAMPAQLATLLPGEPFPSLYRRAALPALRAALRDGRSLRALHTRSAHARDAGDPLLTFSVNTRADLALALARLRRR